MIRYTIYLSLIILFSCVEKEIKRGPRLTDCKVKASILVREIPMAPELSQSFEKTVDSEYADILQTQIENSDSKLKMNDLRFRHFNDSLTTIHELYLDTPQNCDCLNLMKDFTYELQHSFDSLVIQPILQEYSDSLINLELELKEIENQLTLIEESSKTNESDKETFNKLEKEYVSILEKMAYMQITNSGFTKTYVPSILEIERIN